MIPSVAYQTRHCCCLGRYVFSLAGSGEGRQSGRDTCRHQSRGFCRQFGLGGAQPGRRGQAAHRRKVIPGGRTTAAAHTTDYTHCKGRPASAPTQPLPKPTHPTQLHTTVKAEPTTTTTHPLTHFTVLSPLTVQTTTVPPPPTNPQPTRQPLPRPQPTPKTSPTVSTHIHTACIQHRERVPKPPCRPSKR